MNIKDKKRIVIMGDSGRGKSTLAENISGYTKLPLYSTDDLIWKIKFSEQRTKDDSLSMSLDISSLEKWIFEGSSLRLQKSFLDRSDLVIYLEHKNFIGQSFILFKRYLGREHETFLNFINLIKHIFYGRYSVGYKRGRETDLEYLDRLGVRYIKLSSFKEIDEFVKSLNN